MLFEEKDRRSKYRAKRYSQSSTDATPAPSRSPSATPISPLSFTHHSPDPSSSETESGYPSIAHSHRIQFCPRERSCLGKRSHSPCEMSKSFSDSELGSPICSTLTGTSAHSPLDRECGSSAYPINLDQSSPEKELNNHF